MQVNATYPSKQDVFCVAMSHGAGRTLQCANSPTTLALALSILLSVSWALDSMFREMPPPA
eukprot:6176565-Pleurochrysis_carterae.AAC.1